MHRQPEPMKWSRSMRRRSRSSHAHPEVITRTAWPTRPRRASCMSPMNTAAPTRSSTLQATSASPRSRLAAKWGTRSTTQRHGTSSPMRKRAASWRKSTLRPTRLSNALICRVRPATTACTSMRRPGWASLPATDKVVQRIDLSGAAGNHGLYVDAPARLGFIACEGNDRLLVLDLASRKVLARFDLAKDPDVLAFDPTLGWLYVAGESGQVSLFKVQGKTVTALGTAWLGSNAHVVAVDSITHEAFFPLKPARGKPMLRITRPNPQE